MKFFKQLLAAFENNVKELIALVNEVNSATAEKKITLETARLTVREQALTKDLTYLQATQAVHQLQLLRRKYANLLTILNKQLQAEELTFQRYLAVIEQVYHSALENLESIRLALQSISTVDKPRLQARLKALDSNNNQQRAALEQRLQMQATQLQRVKQWLQDNEQALTALDTAAAQLASVKMHTSRTALDLDTAISELNRLSDRARLYGRDAQQSDKR